MKILFANAPWIKEDRRGVKAGSRWPHTIRGKKLEYVPFPFNFAYAAAVLEENGFDVEVLDGIALGIGRKQFLRKVKKSGPDLVVMESSTPSIKDDCAYARKIKEGIETKLCFVGNHVSALPKEVLSGNPIDFGLIGEYDYTLLELSQFLRKGRRSFSKILGLSFKNNGEIVVNKRRPLIKNLDNLPPPARHLFPMNKYNEKFCDRSPNVQMLTSRGCPFRCVFCLEPWVIYGPAYRAWSVKRVIEELKSVVGDYSPKEIYFDDSTFTVSRDRTIELCKEMKKNDIDVPWSCMTAVNTIRDKKMLEEMRNAGCYKMKVGLESAAKEVLRNTGKPYNLRQERRALKWAKECGIGVHVTIMVGLPGETVKTVKITMDYLKKLVEDKLIKTIQCSIATPYPGTKFHEMAKERGWLVSEDWEVFDGSCKSVISYPNLSDKEIEMLRNEVIEYWNLDLLPFSKMMSKAFKIIKSNGIEGFISLIPRGKKYVKHRISS